MTPTRGSKYGVRFSAFFPLAYRDGSYVRNNYFSRTPTAAPRYYNHLFATIKLKHVVLLRLFMAGL